MTCAKRRVTCLLISRSGEILSKGTNDCDNPQQACPRGPDDGYDKCRTICQQYGHAEIVALELAAGKDLAGATAVIINHHRVCAPCWAALTDAGVTEIKFV